MDKILELLEGTPNGVYAVDLDQRVILWNHEAERILGWNAEEALGTYCFDLIGGAHLSSQDSQEPLCRQDCPVIRLARNAEVAPPQRIRAITKSGTSRWLLIIHVLVPSDRRELGVLIHVFTDVTQEMEAERLLQRLSAVLEQPDAPSQVSKELSSTESLTSRELDVLRLLARGTETGQIAQNLVISPVTVRNYIQRILAKLGVHSRLEAVVLAFRQGVL